jgi:hypothetical protein
MGKGQSWYRIIKTSSVAWLDGYYLWLRDSGPNVVTLYLLRVFYYNCCHGYAVKVFWTSQDNIYDMFTTSDFAVVIGGQFTGKS